MKILIERSIRDSIRPIILNKTFANKTIIDINVEIINVGADWSEYYSEYTNYYDTVTFTLVLESPKQEQISFHYLTIKELQQFNKGK